MMIALVSGLAFYSSLLFAEQTWQLIGLQMLNAIFIGITRYHWHGVFPRLNAD